MKYLEEYRDAELFTLPLVLEIDESDEQDRGQEQPDEQRIADTPLAGVLDTLFGKPLAPLLAIVELVIVRSVFVV